MGDIFEDIEQDNNPLFYGNSFASHRTSDEFDKSTVYDPNTTDLVKSTLGVLNHISLVINEPKLAVDIIGTERLMNLLVIVYTIELVAGNLPPVVVKRRYSEFKLLRDHLLQLFPTVIIPPIPEKHTLLNYLINSINNSKEAGIIEVRKRNFKQFLVDLLFFSDPALRQCVLLHKFFDPNYELCWNNAINEPPASLLPNNLLLANPIDPTDQNGLYLLLPVVNGFEFTSLVDNLNSLRKINDDLHKLTEQIRLFHLKEEKAELRESPKKGQKGFSDIPRLLINYEAGFHHNIKVLGDVHRLNHRCIKNFKGMVLILIDLGGNLNNFSLQIHELTHDDNNQLSQYMEKFGSTIDLDFLNFELFVNTHFIPNWQEPIHQLIQYYVTALQIIKFYKYKLIQYKLLHKLKFNKFQELMSFSTSYHDHLKLNDLKKLNIDSPSINDAIRRIESKQKRLASSGKPLNSKKSWYGLFGGNKLFVLPDDQALPPRPQVQRLHLGNISVPQLPQKVPQLPQSTQPPAFDEPSYTPTSPTRQPYTSPTSSPQKVTDINAHYSHKIAHIEKELTKLDQLIAVVNTDMTQLTSHLEINFRHFLDNIEKKWLTIMLEFIRLGKQLFTENLSNWTDFKAYIEAN